MKKYRIEVIITRTETWEIKATDEEDARERVFEDGKILWEHEDDPVMDEVKEIKVKKARGEQK